MGIVVDNKHDIVHLPILVFRKYMLQLTLKKNLIVMERLYLEEQFRKEAIRRYLSGAFTVSIYTQLSKSKRWFFKWLKRYREVGSDWFKNHPKIPHLIANKVDKEIEDIFISSRKRLEGIKYAQIGANAIQWKIKKLGIEPHPVWTINRILKRKNLVSKKKPYEPKGKSYPEIVESSEMNNLHQVDLVGPRYIKGDGRFYSLNVIDICSHIIKLNTMCSKRDEEIANGLISTWKTVGIPEYIQFDNELSFHGSDKHPHSLGLILRLCLSLSIQPIFIPQREPWRNEVIENFNNTFDKKFFRTQTVRDFSLLKEESKVFEKFHNEFHRYSILGGETPNNFIKKNGSKPSLLPKEFELPK